MAKTKYTNVSEIDHVLLRPDMYIGSIFNKREDHFVVIDNLIKKTTIDFNYGLYKIFDEVITNSVDEHVRNKKLTRVSVTITKDTIQIIDNGGITSAFMKEYKCYTPELIFGRLRSGSNFDDTEKRTVAGNFGLGCKLSNIYSKIFTIETSLNKQVYKQTWKKNMKTKGRHTISDSKRNYTKVIFKPELERFELDHITDDMISVMKKRCIDLAAINLGLEITFNNEKFKFKTFEQYCQMYNLEDELFFAQNKHWQVGVSVSSGGFKQVAFVNNTFNTLGGNHVNYILDQIIDFLRPYIKKKYKIDVKPSDIRNQLFLFVNASIVNNRFSSQTKERLVTDPKDFENYFELPLSTLNKIAKSEVVERILDWKRTKLEIAEKVELRKLNKQVGKLKVANLIDCSSKTRDNCVLKIFEGFSAGNGAVKHRDPKTQGLYLLKGKIMNTYGLKPSKILQNKELSGLIATLGLELGNPSIENLRYGKILIVTDMDVDGSNICSLIINFLADNWIGLFEEGRVYRVLTPLLIVRDGKKQKDIYSEEEYEKFKKANPNKTFKIEYKKGLGALSDHDYKAMMESPKLLKIKKDSLYSESLYNWFGKDSNRRKTLLLNKEIEPEKKVKKKVTKKKPIKKPIKKAVAKKKPTKKVNTNLKNRLLDSI